MLSTMQDYALSVSSILEFGARIHAKSEVLTWTGDGARRATFREIAARVRRLAAALVRLGIRAGDRVGTLCWNTQEHLEAYFAVPAMGAVVHTLNLRLFPDQLAFVINHAEDRVILVESSLIPLLAKIADQLRTVERYIVIGEDNGLPGQILPGEVLRYDDLLAAERPEFHWPEIDERSAASMCYTTGTTGEPKGVAYSHRSVYLHALAVCAPWAACLSDRDRILTIVPMFHANAWGFPYAGWLAGCDFLLPGRFLQAEPLCRMIKTFRPTIGAAVPTVLNAALQYGEANNGDFSSFRMVLCGGAAMPRSLGEGFMRHGVKVVAGWGLTETSPVATVAHPPRQCAVGEELDWLVKAGRILPGVDLRICDGEQVLDWDGESVGEIELRGPWIAASYYGAESNEKFHDGWLRTGDVGSVDEYGFVRITDRAKDVIKSGGEWISSVELENAIGYHPDVMEAAVIGVADAKWDERPLACVVRRPGSSVNPGALRAHLAPRVPKWWIPESWAFIDEVPKTSVGKFDKKVLRAWHERGEIVELTERD